MSEILARKGANPWVSGMFFKAVVQEVIIFGEETWVTTPCIGRDLGEIKHRVAQRITGRQTRRLLYGR